MVLLFLCCGWFIGYLFDSVFGCSGWFVVVRLVLIVVFTFWGVGLISYLCEGLSWFSFLVSLGLVDVGIAGLVFVIWIVCFDFVVCWFVYLLVLEFGFYVDYLVCCLRAVDTVLRFVCLLCVVIVLFVLYISYLVVVCVGGLLVYCFVCLLF